MQWLLTAHVRRYHRRHGTTGHVWQGRLEAFPIEDDHHLVTVLRYVERDASRAELVECTEEWKWSSLPAWQRRETWLYRGAPPVRHGPWLERVNEPLSVGDLQRLRHSVARGRPFGGETWTEEVAKRLRLESCLRPPGRPKKQP